MSKELKVGDQVKIIKRRPGNKTGNGDYDKPNGDVGKVGKIVNIFSPISRGSVHDVQELCTNQYLGWFKIEELELVTPTKLKIGDYVKIIKRLPDNRTGFHDWNVPNGDVGKIGKITTIYDNEYNVHPLGSSKCSDYYGQFTKEELELQTTMFNGKPENVSITYRYGKPEENKMELKDIKKDNLKEAKKQFELENTNSEIEHAKTQLRIATNQIDRLDRDKKVFLEEDAEARKIPEEVIAQFKKAK